jgi:serine/threonine protein phosphatase PrpC
VDAPKVTAFGRSDVGRVRVGNEDALLITGNVFAVADGMGGHRAGEVASAAALEPLALLAGRTFPDGTAAIEALTAAAVAANAAVARRSNEDPDLEGMGTTLTALLLEGTTAHLVHVGDSRAYLLRDGVLVQLTDDHTLVQALIDQGRITREQAGTHPHRSVITRAIGVANEVEIDARSLPLQPDDVLLLCSDGLTGVVEDERITDLLTDGSLEATVDALIGAANEAGGPDNVTVLLVRVDGESSGAAPAAEDDTATGVPLNGTRTIRIRTDDAPDGTADWAARYSALGSQGTPGPSFRRGTRPSSPGANGGGGSESARPRLLGNRFDRLVARVVVAVVALAVTGGVLGLGARLILDRAYLVGVHADEIVIYRGFDVQFGPIDLRRVHERPGLLLDEIPIYLHQVYLDGRPAADLGDARRIVAGIPRTTTTTAATDGSSARSSTP